MRTKDKSAGKTYEDATLYIGSRSIASNNYVMQISNISQASIGAIPKKKPSPVIILILSFVALIGLFSGFYGYIFEWKYVIVGAAASAMLALYIYYFYNKRQQHGLSLELNSGNIMNFVSYRKDFLADVLNMIIARMEYPEVRQEIYETHFSEGSVKIINHYGSGDIIVDSEINIYNINYNLLNDQALQKMDQLLKLVELAASNNLALQERLDVLESLKDMRDGAKEKDTDNGKSKIRRALQLLKTAAQKVASTTAFAASVAELINFFASL